MIFIYEGARPEFYWKYVRALSLELRDLGYQTKIVRNVTSGDDNDIYIIFMPHFLIKKNLFPKIKTKKIIIYNTEQLKWNAWNFLFEGLRKLSDVDIWCHSKTDYDYLTKNKIKVKFFPIGYSKYFEYKSENPHSFQNKNCVFLSYGGGLTQKRKDQMKKLISLKVIGNCWNMNDYKKMVDSHFLYINIYKRDDKEYWNPLRVFPLVANKCLVLNEYADDGIDVMKEISIIFKDVKEANEKIKYYLDNPDEAEKIISKHYNWFKENYSFAKLFKESGCAKSLSDLVKLNVVNKYNKMGTIYKNKKRISGSQSEIPKIILKKDQCEINGYQHFLMTKNQIIPKKYCGKFEYIKKFLSDNSKLESITDLGCSNGIVCFLAHHSGFKKIYGLDHDIECLKLIKNIKEHMNITNVFEKKYSFGDSFETSDIIIACALIHWIYSCTSLNGEFDRIIKYLRDHSNKYLIIEWVDPADSAIKSFKHIKFNSNIIKEEYNKNNFLTSLRKYYSKVNKVFSVTKTRELYLCEI